MQAGIVGAGKEQLTQSDSSEDRVITKWNPELKLR